MTNVYGICGELWPCKASKTKKRFERATVTVEA